ncbi:protein ZBED8-like [Rhopalosiphum maidis]|uniref:protein ZBED8-like n=1 Tax=Rhopalosiphum maidis TaxID=43146 RepID=UPI000EFFF371|nr:protein ZBED8-like [Rhopalosiphum maidis]
MSTKLKQLSGHQKRKIKGKKNLEFKKAKGSLDAFVKKHNLDNVIAEIIVKNLKPHTIAESLILPACSEIVKIMFGDDAKNEIMKIPHSDDTIKNRIIHMSDDIEKTVFNKLSKSYFALQIDESTDISGIAHVLGFVRFINENK